MINRRIFLKNLTLSAGSIPVLGKTFPEFGNKKTPGRGKILNAYYLRAQMYTCVPRQVKEDMKWMAGTGTNVVTVSVLEQDLWAAERNIDEICNAADKEGIKVWADPSRWGGLVAGAPKVPSLFSVCHPDTWVLKKEGKPLFARTTSGVVSSIYHPDTLSFFCETADKMLSKFNFKGVIWDEPKHIGTKDYSPAALKVLGTNSSYPERVGGYGKFFSSVNAYIRKKHPDIKLSLFTYANSNDIIVKEMAAVKCLDYYGCDGRPWSKADGGQDEDGKTLLDNGPKFIHAAKRNRIQSLLLIENHDLPESNFELLRRGIPKVTAMDPDQLIYYYYPRNVENVAKEMDIVRQGLKNYTVAR